MTTGTHAKYEALVAGVERVDGMTLSMMHRAARRRIEGAPERFAAEREHLENLEVSLAEFCAAYSEMSRQFEDLFARLHASKVGEAG